MSPNPATTCHQGDAHGGGRPQGQASEQARMAKQ